MSSTSTTDKYPKFDRQLQLMIMLTQNTKYTIGQIGRILDMSVRTIYRYLEAFRDMGFHVSKQGSVYRIDKDSPFFDKITYKVRFTESEAMTIAQLLFSVHDNSSQIRALRNKLSKLYDYKVLQAHNVNEMLARNINTLYEAIKQERTVILRDYNSTNSRTVSDRLVEPYLFLSSNDEVRGYEITSGKNKTFKVSRIREVDMLEVFWTNKDKHLPFHTDIFHFSGEETRPVTLRLSRLATLIFLEEHPEASNELKREEDGSSLLTTQVCSFKGVGRFVMGLAEEIDVIDSPDFLAYLKEKSKDLTLKFQN